MNEMATLPTALRLRRLLHQQGFRLRPWCTQVEILDTFYGHLAAAACADDFWQQLGTLAQELALDLERPMLGNPYGVNIASNTVQLLDEIRVALAAARDAQRGYRALHRELPANAMTLLLAVSIAAVGCGGAVASEQDPSPAVGGSSSGNTAHVGGTSSSTVLGQGGSSGVSRTTRISIFGDGGSGPMASTDDLAGGADGASFPQTPCREPSEPAPTVEELMDACGIDARVKEEYLSVLNASEASWPAGFAAYFACQNCGNLAMFLGTCSSDGLRTVGYPFANDPWQMCQPVPIYIGVRFS